MVEAESAVEKQKGWETPNISWKAAFWISFLCPEKMPTKWYTGKKDAPLYFSGQLFIIHSLFVGCKLPLVQMEQLEKDSLFQSCLEVWEMPFDSFDKQRKGLYNQCYVS